MGSIVDTEVSRSGIPGSAAAYIDGRHRLGGVVCQLLRDGS